MSNYLHWFDLIIDYLSLQVIAIKITISVALFSCISILHYSFEIMQCYLQFLEFKFKFVQC